MARCYQGWREAFGLLVDDGAVAVGIRCAVGAAALLSIPVLFGSGDAVGWALFALAWAIRWSSAS